MSWWIDSARVPLVAFALTALTGCGLFTTSRADAPPDPATQVVNPATVALTDPVVVARGLTPSATPTAAWRGARAELLLDAWVHASLLDAVDPAAAAPWWAVIADAVASQPQASDLDARVAAAIRDDLAASGATPDRVGRAAALVAVDPALAEPEAVWLQWAASDPWIAPRARGLALARAAAWLPAWASRGTGGGGPMARECSFLCGVDDAELADAQSLANAAGYRCPEADGEPSFDPVLDGVVPRTPGWPAWELLRRCGPDWHGFPVQLGAPLLLSEANWLDAVVLRNLADLVSQVRADATGGARSVASLAQHLDALATRLASTSVPLAVTANVFLHDVRLDLPRGFDAFDASVRTGFVAEPELRMILVRSDGARVAMRPHLRLDPDHPVGVDFASVGDDWHLPGTLAVRFERPGAIAGDEIVAGGAPGLGEALDQLEVDLASAEVVDPAAMTRRPVSLFVDGNAYWGSLQPLLVTLADRDYGPIVFHTWLRAHEMLGVAPLRLRFDAPEAAHRIVVRSDGFIVEPYSEDGLAEPTVISRAEPESLLALHRWLAEAVTDGGALSDGLPVLIRVDDGSTDVGMLVHMTSAIAWQRDLTDTTRDRDLLVAPLVFDGVTPRALLDGGVQVIVEAR